MISVNSLNISSFKISVSGNNLKKNYERVIGVEAAVSLTGTCYLTVIVYGSQGVNVYFSNYQ